MCKFNWLLNTIQCEYILKYNINIYKYVIYQIKLKYKDIVF